MIPYLGNMDYVLKQVTFTHNALVVLEIRK